METSIAMLAIVGGLTVIYGNWRCCEVIRNTIEMILTVLLRIVLFFVFWGMAFGILWVLVKTVKFVWYA